MYFAVMYNSSMFEIYVLTDRQTDRHPATKVHAQAILKKLYGLCGVT